MNPRAAADRPAKGIRLRAEVHGPSEIRAQIVGGDPPTSVASYRLTEARGEPVQLSAARVSGQAVSLSPAAPIDPQRVHYLEVPELNLRALVRRDPIFRRMRSSKTLGARVADDGRRTDFRIFAPRASAIRLYLYDTANVDDARQVIEMTRDADGVWETSELGDLHGTWYDFTVHGPADTGNYFYESRPSHISDPYALVNDDALGRSRVWRDAPPPPPVRGGRPRMEDVVAYEVHVQDFTDLLPAAPAEVGHLAAMVQPGLRNADGQPIGFDYLVDLGVNVVHLMPVQEYLHYPDEVWQAAFADDPFAKAMAIDRENYQWGYRTTHPFAVESRFRSPGTQPGAERDQFRALVRAFHERGISVVIDVVPNHTGENMDGRHLLIHFNVLDLPYYYRTDDDLAHIGPFGNEIKTEERPMVQRWMLDQMRHWVERLGVDGFRIDLAGQIDRQTLSMLRRELPDDLIIYGEPWIAPSDPDVRANPEWSWYKANAPITFFQDDARDAFSGSPFDINDRGWAGGRAELRDAVMRALANEYLEEPRSTDGISYLDIHDNWALADRYALRDHNGLAGVDLGAMRIAAGLLLTSAGPVVVHGGTEMLRSKGLAPLEQREAYVAGGPILFNGRHDTYNLRAPNRFSWDSLTPGSEATAMRDYWRGLITMRRSSYGEVFRVADVPAGHYRWVTPESGHLLGYLVGDRVLVLANAGSKPGDFDIELDGSWRQVGFQSHVDLDAEDGARLDTGSRSIPVPGRTFLIWVRD